MNYNQPDNSMEVGANTVQVFDQNGSDLLFECPLSEMDKAYAFASKMEVYGVEVRIVAPSLPASLANSLGKDNSALNADLDKEISDHSPCTAPDCLKSLLPLVLFFVFFLFSVPKVQAGLYFQHSFIYYSTEDDSEQFTYSMMRNLSVVGSTFGKNDQLVIGWSFLKWSKEHQGSASTTSVDLSLLEMGPRFIWYMDQDKNISLSAIWNPFVSGDRTTSAGVAEDITGNSYLVSLIYQFKVSKHFFIGASLNYHATSIAESKVGTTATDETDSYTDLYPAFDFSFRFK